MCGAPDQDVLTLDGVDTGRESVVQGVVRSDGSPVSGAYVRLLDASGEFTAEVRTSATGHFRFFAAPGDWTLRTLTRGRTVDTPVTAAVGVVEAAVEVPA